MWEGDTKAAAKPAPRQLPKQDSTPPPKLAAAGWFDSDVPSPCDVGAGGRERGGFDGYFAAAAAAAAAPGETGDKEEAEAVDDNDDDVTLPSADDADVEVNGGDSDDGGEETDLMFAFDDL